MSRALSLLTVGLLMLGMGSIGAGALPRSEWAAGRPTAIELRPAQYSDNGRCFNTCISGRIFRRCEVTSDGDKAGCCSLACNRLNNWYGDQ